MHTFRVTGQSHILCTSLAIHKCKALFKTYKLIIFDKCETIPRHSTIPMINQFPTFNALILTNTSNLKN
jgi:hypothetical protein